MDNKIRGVFAAGAPKRPNPIGISVVRKKPISTEQDLTKTGCRDRKPIQGGKKMRRTKWLQVGLLVLAVFMASLLIYPQAGWAKEKLVLSTGSPYELGLIDALARPFEAKYNCKVDVMKAGSGKAIKLLRAGNVDVIIVHAKKAEEKLVKDGYGLNRRLVAHNDFVIAGPKKGPGQDKRIKRCS